MDGLSGFPRQMAVATIAACAFRFFGYNMSVMGGTRIPDLFLGKWLP